METVCYIFRVVQNKKEKKELILFDQSFASYYVPDMSVPMAVR